MWNAFRKLTPLDWAVVGAGLMVVAILQVWPDRSREFDDDQPIELRPQTRAMGKQTERRFQEWQATARYFGAFAISQDGRAWGWTNQHSTLAAAEANAMAHCVANGTGCTIIERRAPPPSDGAVMGSEKTQAELFRFDRSTGPGAFAMSDNGASAWVAGRPSAAVAEAEALARCEVQTKKGQAEYLPHWPCRLFKSRPR